MRKEKLEELNNYINELKTKRLDIIEKSGKFISVERYKCRLNNGMVIPREKIIKNGKNGSASVVLPITKEGNALLVVQPRAFTKNTVCVECPAGYIEDGEEPMMAGIRELEEETGYVPKEMMFLASYYQDQGCSSAFNYSYLALGCEKKKMQNLDKNEVIRYFECSFDEALELVDLGYISDVNSQLALEKSKQYVRR